MSIVLDAPATTGTRIAELTRDGVTLRLSVTDGQPWIALEREQDGRAQCLAMPLDVNARIWLGSCLDDIAHSWEIPGRWEELEP